MLTTLAYDTIKHYQAGNSNGKKRSTGHLWVIIHSRLFSLIPIGHWTNECYQFKDHPYFEIKPFTMMNIIFLI
ncbi:MAG: hypothetical protein CBB72_014410 [Muricauda sp. TMED12]|nr:MAG: hypothetical protein CBB72_014410 [Muricauda sp. TMED12]